MKPTLDQFLATSWPKNAYIEYPGLRSLYVRKGSFGVVHEGVFYRCHNGLTIASVEAEVPGAGAFTRLVEDLVVRGMAVYVRNCHNERLYAKLVRDGFKPVNKETGPHLLLATVSDLEVWES